MLMRVSMGYLVEVDPSCLIATLGVSTRHAQQHVNMGDQSVNVCSTFFGALDLGFRGPPARADQSRVSADYSHVVVRALYLERRWGVPLIGRAKCRSRWDSPSQIGSPHQARSVDTAGLAGPPRASSGGAPRRRG